MSTGQDRVVCDRCDNEFERDDLIPTDTGGYCEACFEDIHESSREPGEAEEG